MGLVVVKLANWDAMALWEVVGWGGRCGRDTKQPFLVTYRFINTLLPNLGFHSTLLRSYISTIRKQGLSVWEALGSLFNGDVLIPQLTPE